MTGIDFTNDASAVIQFENANEGRSYPFDDNEDLVSVDGKELPLDVITDIHLVIPSECDAYLSSVYISDSMLSACVKIVSSDTSSIEAALSVTINKDSLIPYSPYRLEKLVGSEDVGGVITFGNIDFPAYPSKYQFSGLGARLSPSTISRYEPASLRSLIDDRTGEKVSGDVSVTFSSYVTAENDNGKVRLTLDAASNDILLPECLRKMPINACGATPVMTINGIAPDDEKRLVIWFH